jgi:hypothetical protein
MVSMDEELLRRVAADQEARHARDAEAAWLLAQPADRDPASCPECGHEVTFRILS